MAIGRAPTRIARSRADTSTEPQASSVPRATPSDASQGHGWLSPTRNTNVRPAKVGKACGWTPGSATNQVPPAPSRLERWRALRSLGSTATARCGAMPCASSGRSAVSTAMISARSCRRWRSAMTRSSDGPAAATIAGTPSNAPASASASPSRATTPRFSTVFRRYGAAKAASAPALPRASATTRAPTAAARRTSSGYSRASTGWTTISGAVSPIDTRRHARSAPR